MNKETLIKEQLKKDFDKLDKSVEVLKHSLRQCKTIGIKKKYTLEELDKFEALTSRFARTSDIFTQKIMKGIILLLREEAYTYIDKCNLFEKLNISSCEELKMIRDLRNEISHDYNLKDITEIFKDVLDFSDKLLKIIENTKKFCKEKFLI